MHFKKCVHVYASVGPFHTPFCFFVWIRHHGRRVCPARTTGLIYEETAEPTGHTVEVPGGQAAGLSSQLLGETGKHTHTIYRNVIVCFMALWDYMQHVETIFIN